MIKGNPQDTYRRPRYWWGQEAACGLREDSSRIQVSCGLLTDSQVICLPACRKAGYRAPAPGNQEPPAPPEPVNE